MDCRHVRDQLVWYIVGEMAEAEREPIEQHLAECSACREACENLRSTLGRQADEAAESRVRPQFREALRAEIRSEIALARRGRRRLRQLRWAVSAAAVLTVMLGLGLLMRHHGAGKASRPGGYAELPEIWRHEGISSSHTTTLDAPAVHDDSVYGLEAVGDGRRVVAVNAKTGRCRWRSRAGVWGYLAADASRVYAVGSGPKSQRDLLALDAGTGKVVWSYVPEGAAVHGATSTPLLLGKRLCWCRGSGVFLIDGETGSRIWERSFPEGSALSRPVGQADRIWVVAGKTLHALDVADGHVVRSKALCERTTRFSRPLLAVSGTNCYVAVRSSPGRTRLLCYSPDRDDLVWDTTVDRVAHLQAFGDIVITRSDRLQAWDGASGRLLWAYAAEGCGPVCPIGGNLCFVDAEGSGALVMLETRTGRLVNRYAGKRSCAGLVVGEQIGYLNAQDGVLYAVRMEKA